MKANKETGYRAPLLELVEIDSAEICQAASPQYTVTNQDFTVENW